MKISQARMAFASEYQSEKMDTQIDEKLQKEFRLASQRRKMSGSGELSQILVDRVSISQGQVMDIKSSYSADVQSISSVKSEDLDVSAEYAQNWAMEKIVGGIIDKQVVVKQIKQNQDIRMGSGQSDTPENVPGSQPDGSDVRPFQNQLRPGRFRSLQASQVTMSNTEIYFEQESAQFSSQGQVTTQDGRVIDFSLDMSLERSFLSRKEETTLIRRWQEQINLTDPLVISMDGKAPVLSDTVFEFDLDNDGEMENVNFAGRGSGFLALDRNADNIINNGSELFGPGTGNGFNELADFDEDQNHWIDENDAVFSQLSVWTKDDDGNDRLISLKDAGVGAIALDYADTVFNMTGTDNRLNGQLKQSGIFLFENGNVGSVHQVDLVSHEIIEQKSPLAGQQNIEYIQPDTEPAMENLLQNSRITPPARSEVMSSPLQDLLDRIEQLKEKFASMMQEMNPLFERKSIRGGHGRFYENFRIDPSDLLSRGRDLPGGLFRGRRWYG